MPVPPVASSAADGPSRSRRTKRVGIDRLRGVNLLPRPAAPRRRMVSCMATPKEILRINDREVAISNPQKVYFPETGYTKLDLVTTTWPSRMAPCAAPRAGRWP